MNDNNERKAEFENREVVRWDAGHDEFEGWLDRCQVSRYSGQYQMKGKEALEWLKAACKVAPGILEPYSYDGRVAFRSTRPRLHVIAALYDGASWLPNPYDASEMFAIIPLISDAIRTMQIVEGFEFGEKTIYWFPGISWPD